MTTPEHKTFEFGPFLLDPTERVLLRDGRPVPLTLKAFDVLLLLVENSSVMGRSVGGIHLRE